MDDRWHPVTVVDGKIVAGDVPPECSRAWLTIVSTRDDEKGETFVVDDFYTDNRELKYEHQLSWGDWGSDPYEQIIAWMVMDEPAPYNFVKDDTIGTDWEYVETDFDWNITKGLKPRPESNVEVQLYRFDENGTMIEWIDPWFYVDDKGNFAMASDDQFLKSQYVRIHAWRYKESYLKMRQITRGILVGV